MNIVGVADTHAALWHLYDDPHLSRVAGQSIEKAEVEGNKVAVSSITLVEVVHLVEKRRILSSACEDLIEALDNPHHVFVEAFVSGAVARSMRQVSRSLVPHMPDRIVAATALHFGVPVLSRDGQIRASSMTTIW